MQLSTMTSVHDSFAAIEKSKAENATKSSPYVEKRKTVMNFVFAFHNVCDLTRRTNAQCTSILTYYLLCRNYCKLPYTLPNNTFEKSRPTLLDT